MISIYPSVWTDSNPLPVHDHVDAVASGKVPGASVFTVSGYKSGVANTLDDINELGVSITPIPPSAIAMEIISSNIADTAGVELSAGTVTSGSTTILIDTTATFITDGVIAGDKVYNTTSNCFVNVVSVDSETQITNQFSALISHSPSQAALP